MLIYSPSFYSWDVDNRVLRHRYLFIPAHANEIPPKKKRSKTSLLNYLYLLSFGESGQLLAVSRSSSYLNSSTSHSILPRESLYLSITSQSAMSARKVLFWKDRSLLATVNNPPTAAILFRFATFYDLTVTLREVVTSRKLPKVLQSTLAVHRSVQFCMEGKGTLSVHWPV